MFDRVIPFLRRSGMLTALASGLLLSGCTNLVYKTAGDGMIGYGTDVMIPFLMTLDDGEMGCAGGEAMTPLFLSFGAVTNPPDDLSVLIYLVNGGCATKRAEEFNLDFIRLNREKRIEEAQDARIKSKRWNAIAAQRLLKGYEALTRSLGEPGEKCPNFKSETDQMIWMFGTVVGLGAVVNDAKSGGAVGVPVSIAPKAERAAACLDTPEGNQKWWGMPMAIRAALWTMVPGITPQGRDPWKTMDEGMKIGEEQGVRIVSGFVGGMALNSDNTPLLRDVIRRHAQSLKTTASNPDFRMVDSMATDMLTQLSDQMWTEATGHRTPMGSYGQFWDEKTKAKEVDVDFDDLL